MRTLLLATSLLVALAGAASAGAKKQPPVTVRFHAQGGSEGGEFSQPVQLLQSGRSVTMQTMPLLTESEIKSFHPFAATDGSGTMGAYFRLDAHGVNLLSQHTMSRRGTYMMAFFNGRHVVDLYVDRGVKDGIAAIPSGLTAHDITLLDLTFPRFGHEGEKPAGLQKPKPTPASARPSPTPPLRLQPAMARQPDGTLAPARAIPGAGDPAPTQLSPVGQR